MSAEQARLAFDSMGPDEQDLVSFAKFSEWFQQQSAKGTSSTEEKAPAKKKQKVSAVASAAAGNAAPATAPATSTATSSLPASRRTALLKAIATGLKASIKTKKWYAHGGSEDCAGETVMSEEEFKTVFGSIGTVDVGKDGEGKKASTVVTNKHLNATDCQTVFGTLIEGISVNTFNKPHNFQKQFKTGKASVTVQNATVGYSKNTQMCKLKFSVSNGGVPGSGYSFSGYHDRDGDY